MLILFEAICLIFIRLMIIFSPITSPSFHEDFSQAMNNDTATLFAGIMPISRRGSLPESAGNNYQNSQMVLMENGTCAGGAGTLVTFNCQQIGSGNFTRLYETCHDPDLALTYYSKHWIRGRALAEADTKHKRKSNFNQGNYFPGLQVNNLYTVVEQTKALETILGSADLAREYINSKKQLFFSRGHLAPDADFIDAFSQDATYYFLNTAPQWQTFNGGNWNRLENAVRNLALNRNAHLTIYTGTFGVTTLADVQGVHQPIYLTFDENGNGLIPAPKYYWKLIHNTDSNTATAVIGINNPYSNVKTEDVLCPDVCNQVKWVDWKLKDIHKGYTFCCTAAELHKVVHFAPNLNVSLYI